MTGMRDLQLALSASIQVSIRLLFGRENGNNIHDGCNSMVFDRLDW